MTKIIKIGTRGSQLALWQANWVKCEIEKILSCIDNELNENSANINCLNSSTKDVLDNALSIPTIEIVKIKTTGDQITDRPLSMVGGKGLFVKEIEQQLLDGQIDIAVHSMKDMPADLPDGLTIGAIPVRANPFDVIISRDNIPLNDLPAGSRVGTSSLRRASQIKHTRPDITPISIRGNLDTRLRKLDTGEYDAIILAAAGLIRLGMKDRITQYLDENTMVPAVGQGALCVESRQIHGESEKHDLLISKIMAKLDDINTRIPVEAERAFLKKMEGSCHIPVACFGKLENKEKENSNSLPLTLTGLVASEDGSTIIKESLTYLINKEPKECSTIAKNAGIELADLLLNKGAKKILESLK
ncbi:MAG: hydroxymethylbilane synthase [Desulfamplus sp.]|nr:hydroxymethylbilane synthase [Desulfamplus sp.]